MGGRRQHLTVVIYLNLPIRDVECLPMCFCKSYSENPIYLLKLASCKSAVLSSYLMIYPRTFLEVRSPLQPHRLYEYEGPLSVGGCKVTIRRNVYKAAALPYAPLELKQMELSKSSSWVVNKTGMCQHKHPRACIPLFLYPHLSPNPLQGIPNRYILRLLV